uniref:Uncharacterized protein n=1 Tax=Candidatus Kentrum sp. UNK TaxID=2126344 RepID=A0A451AE02_9GAMM|nr:MAG: hypothetical protein BECKUNK1418G_GA0071005_104413 [Candidatus Kentron sp. UNK]VFK71046.1 MAG: hypothetical protein BECKUNK1418H_GA0071006_104813 [Candidatus Kentron sp. UNK]
MCAMYVEGWNSAEGAYSTRTGYGNVEASMVEYGTGQIEVFRIMGPYSTHHERPCRRGRLRYA